MCVFFRCAYFSLIIRCLVVLVFGVCFFVTPFLLLSLSEVIVAFLCWFPDALPGPVSSGERRVSFVSRNPHASVVVVFIPFSSHHFKSCHVASDPTEQCATHSTAHHVTLQCTVTQCQYTPPHHITIAHHIHRKPRQHHKTLHSSSSLPRHMSS